MNLASRRREIHDLGTRSFEDRRLVEDVGDERRSAMVRMMGLRAFVGRD